MDVKGGALKLLLGAFKLRTDEIITDQAQNIPAYVQTMDNWHNVMMPSEGGRGQMKYLLTGRACQ